jgi:hypothetical protein
MIILIVKVFFTKIKSKITKDYKKSIGFSKSVLDLLKKIKECI